MPTELTDPFDIQLSAQWGCAPASEQLFFADMPVAHVVAYEEHRRETRLAKVVAAGLRPDHSVRSAGSSLEIWPA